MLFHQGLSLFLIAADCTGLQPSIRIEVWTAWAIFWFMLGLICIAFSHHKPPGRRVSLASIIVDLGSRSWLSQGYI
jgi:hypothetical protein